MTLRVPYIADDALERDAEALLAQYAYAKGAEIRAPIPIEDIAVTSRSSGMRSGRRLSADRAKPRSGWNCKRICTHRAY